MEARVELVRSGDRTRTSCIHEPTCVRAASALTNWASQTDIWERWYLYLRDEHVWLGLCVHLNFMFTIWLSGPYYKYRTFHDMINMSDRLTSILHVYYLYLSGPHYKYCTFHDMINNEWSADINSLCLLSIFQVHTTSIAHSMTWLTTSNRLTSIL